MFNSGDTETKSVNLTYRDILILPFEGQHSSASSSPIKSPTETKIVASSVNPARNVNGQAIPPRKELVVPTGKLATTNIGINDLLNPIRKVGETTESESTSTQSENFTIEALERVWKAYSLEVKRNKKDSLYSTLQSKMSFTSDFQIHLELVNSVQAAEIEKEKPELLAYLRSQLRNNSIGLHYKIVEATKVQSLDSRGVYEKLSEENTSLSKFRKLFNLDIEF